MPFHWAIQVVVSPPKWPNMPPATSTGPQPAPPSKTVTASTTLVGPSPSEAQSEPSQRAIQGMLTPPALVKAPATISSGPVQPSS